MSEKREEGLTIPKLYKYRSFDDKKTVLSPISKMEIPLWQHQLFDGFMFSSPPHRFNDPFDCDLTIDGSFLQNMAARELFVDTLSETHDLTPEQEEALLDAEDWKSEIERILGETLPADIEDQLMAEMNRTFSNIRKDFQVLCFTEVKDSILMWSHYADNHKGFCIEYDLQAFKLSDRLQRVQYSKKRRLIPGTFADNADSVRNEIYRATLRKSAEWKYEREWRLVFNINELGAIGLFVGKHCFQLKPFITGVYLGAKVEDKYQELICEHFKATGIKIYRMKMKCDSYSLKAERIQ